MRFGLWRAAAFRIVSDTLVSVYYPLEVYDKSTNWTQRAQISTKAKILT